MKSGTWPHCNTRSICIQKHEDCVGLRGLCHLVRKKSQSFRGFKLHFSGSASTYVAFTSGLWPPRQSTAELARWRQKGTRQSCHRLKTLPIAFSHISFVTSPTPSSPLSLCSCPESDQKQRGRINMGLLKWTFREKLCTFWKGQKGKRNILYGWCKW